MNNGNYLLYNFSKRSRNSSSSSSAASNSPANTRSKSTSSIISTTNGNGNGHESSFSSSSYPTLPTIYENDDDDTTIGEINVHLDGSSSFSVDNSATTISSTSTNGYDDREVYNYYDFDESIMRREETDGDSTSSYTDEETDTEYVGEIKVKYSEEAEEENRDYETRRTRTRTRPRTNQQFYGIPRKQLVIKEIEKDKTPPPKLILQPIHKHSSQMFSTINGVPQTQRNGSLADKNSSINPAAERNKKEKSQNTSARSSASDSSSYKENKISKSTNSKQSRKSHDEVIEISSQDTLKVKGINSKERHHLVHELKNLNDQFVECICQEFKLVDKNLKTLVKTKCKGPERKMVRSTEYDTYEYDYFGNVHKKKFPYYPFGIIRQQICTKPKTRRQGGDAKPKSAKINPKWVN